MQKREISVASFFFGDGGHLDFDAAGTYKILRLPPNSLVIRSKINSMEPIPISVSVGFTSTGNQISGDTSLNGVGTRRTNLFVFDPLFTNSERFVYLHLPAALPKGDWILVVEYIEFKKTSGEYTRITHETE